jgi:hypothetical protein
MKCKREQEKTTPEKDLKNKNQDAGQKAQERIETKMNKTGGKLKETLVPIINGTVSIEEDERNKMREGNRLDQLLKKTERYLLTLSQGIYFSH